MKRYASLLLCLLLTGCSALPQPREMENMSLVRVLGVDVTGQEWVLTGLAGEELLTGRGKTVAEAAEHLRTGSSSTVFLGYVDQILLGRGVFEPEPLFELIRTDRELSLGAFLWTLPHTLAGTALSAPGADRRLATLRQNGAAVRTVGQVWADRLEHRPSPIPALAERGGLLWPIL